MRSLLLFSYLLFSSLIFSQEIDLEIEKLSKIEFSYSYGVSYLEYAEFNLEDPLGFQVTPFGSFQDLNLDFRLPKDRFIGLGYSRQQHSKMIDRDIYLSNGSIFIFSDYKNILQSNYIDVHFRQVFKGGFQLTFGLYYLNQTENALLASFFENSADVFLYGDVIHDAGLFISPEFFLMSDTT